MNATLQALGATLVFALTLGAFGPALDAEPYGTPALIAAQPGEIHRIEVEARALCREHGGDNTGYIATADGGIVCTNKHGRRNVIQVLHRSEP